jgi:cell wall integrity and stress response component
MAVTKFGLLALVAMGAAQVSGKSNLQPPAEDARLNQATSQGCFSTLPSKATVVQDRTFMTTGQCWSHCIKEDKSVAILFGTKCYCSDTYPAKTSLVDDSQCNFNCPGYAREACGGMHPVVYSVYNTGIELDPEYDNVEDKDDDSSTSTASAFFTARESHTGSGTTTQGVKITSVSTSASDTTSYTTSVTETETEDASTPTVGAEETSKIAPVVNEHSAAATPSASVSTVPKNASPRLSNPIGNIVRMVMQLL